jgi:hypothetical protein
MVNQLHGRLWQALSLRVADVAVENGFLRRHGTR